MIHDLSRLPRMTQFRGFVLLLGPLTSVLGAEITLPIDIPGSAQTMPAGINAKGDVAGYTTDSSGSYHGFLRSAIGTITTFDVPASDGFSTYVTGINNSDQIVGNYYFSAGNTSGYLREANGSITPIYLDATQSTSASTVLNGINSSGTVVGAHYSDNSAIGFLRTHDGTITTFQVPGAYGTVATSINDGGETAGYFDGPEGQLAFVRSADGAYQTFGVTGQKTWLNHPVALNDSGTAAMYYQLVPCPGSDVFCGFTKPKGYLRFASGVIAPLIVQPGVAVSVAGINSVGEVVGTYYPGLIPTGFIRHAGGDYVSFTAFGSFTFATAISDLGIVAGEYVALNGRLPGFVRLP